MRSYERRSCSPAPAKSTGFVVVAAAGSSAARRAEAADDRRGSSSPNRDARSAATTAEPPPSATIASFRPRGGCERVADQGACVRPRGSNAGAAHAAREQDDRLARLRRRLRDAREVPSVPEVLAVDADQPGCVVHGQSANELRRLEVGLVAERGEAGDSEAGLRR